MNLSKTEQNYSWIDIKNYILDFINEDEELNEMLKGKIVLQINGISVSMNKDYLAVNKYLYFVNLSYFLMYKENLLNGKFKALPNGSAFDLLIEEKTLYHNLPKLKLSNKIEDVINKTMNYFKSFTVEELIEINHTDIPWIDVWKNKGSNGTIIDLNKYIDCFKTLPMYRRYLEALNFKVKDSILV